MILFAQIYNKPLILVTLYLDYLYPFQVLKAWSKKDNHYYRFMKNTHFYKAILIWIVFLKNSTLLIRYCF